MRHALAAIDAPIFLRRPVVLTSPCLKIRLGAVRQEHAPCGLEIGSRLVERRRGTALMFAGMRSRIEPAAPFPRIGVGWIARADRDRSDAHIEVVDVPRHLQGVRAAAACEGGLAPEFRRSGRELKPLDIVGLCYLDALWRSAGRDWSRIARFGPNGI
jgi:hypothetical protein